MVVPSDPLLPHPRLSPWFSAARTREVILRAINHILVRKETNFSYGLKWFFFGLEALPLIGPEYSAEPRKVVKLELAAPSRAFGAVQAVCAVVG